MDKMEKRQNDFKRNGSVVEMNPMSLTSVGEKNQVARALAAAATRHTRDVLVGDQTQQRPPCQTTDDDDYRLLSLTRLTSTI